MGFILGTIGMVLCGKGAVYSGGKLGAKIGAVFGPKGALIGAAIGATAAKCMVTIAVVAPA